MSGPAKPSTYAQRSRRIVRSAARLNNGADLFIDSTGLVRARPRRSLPSVPWAGLAMIVAAGLLLKTLAIAHLGPTAYARMTDTLANGNTADRVAATLLQVDPITAAMAHQIVVLVNRGQDLRAASGL